LGSPVRYDDYGAVIIGGGLGHFLAVMILTFLAQIINFPLQRNITFRSKGNPAFQAFMYFVGWVLIQPFVMAIGSLWRIAEAALLDGSNLPGIVVALIDMVIIGGVSMVIFFFIFLVIFPDRNKVLKSKQAAYDKLKATNAPSDKLAKAEAQLKDAKIRADYANADKEAGKTAAQASARAISYNASLRAYEKAKVKLEALNGQSGMKLAKAQQHYAICQARIPKKHQEVSDAVVAKDKARESYEAIQPEYAAYIEAVATAKGK
jgi:hypothetical protein